MQNHPVVLLVILTGTLVGVVSFARGERPASRFRLWTDVVAVLPPAATLILFFSLAVHMHHTLGAWPTSLGDAGFSGPLATHAHVAQLCFAVVLATTLFVLPVAAVSCRLVPGLRRWRRTTGIHGIACAVCFGSTLLAPSGFLDWWWD